MSVELNHTIIHARNSRESAEFLAHILGLTVGDQWGHFIPVATANGVTLDYMTSTAETITVQHYAFLISEEEFDAAFERLQKTGVEYYADPSMSSPGQINHHYGGRGVYFLDPTGHAMEMITQPYDTSG
ncbi:VOC family protein [Embleya sp. AB8]|uniref:VOC family protein n=1 Tax=Embleya sp. AB8 TaxID=3156304 RepID=UPI003C769D81